MSVAELQAELAGAGFELTAPLARDVYDAHVAPAWRCARVRPSCRTVLVVGSGGRGFWSCLARAPEARDPEHPADRYTRRVLEQAAWRASPPATLALYFEQRANSFLPLLKLAELAGIGAPGRIGILIHPVYGPWISLRGALFVDEAIAASPRRVRTLCEDCPAPCESACRGRAISRSGLDISLCTATKLVQPACASGCDARCACVVGREHAFNADQIAHHSQMRAAASRWPTDK